MTNAYNFGNFLNRFKGKNIDFDGYAGNQCADLPRKYIEDDDGWACQSYYYRPFTGNGAYGNDGVLDGFLSFEAGQQSIVQREATDRKGKKFKVEIIKDVNNWVEGDIVFFQTSNPKGYGHVGLRTNSDKVPGNVEIFDQNFDGKGGVCWWHNLPKSQFVAALRKTYIEEPPTPPTPPTPPIDPCAEQKEAVRVQASIIAGKDTEISQLKTDLDLLMDVKAKNELLSQANLELTDKYNRLEIASTESEKDLVEDIADLTAEIDLLNEQLQSTPESFDLGKYILGLVRYGTIDQIIGASASVAMSMLPFFFPELNNNQYWTAVIIPLLTSSVTAYQKGQKQIEKAKNQ